MLKVDDLSPRINAELDRLDAARDQPSGVAAEAPARQRSGRLSDGAGSDVARAAQPSAEVVAGATPIARVLPAKRQAATTGCGLVCVLPVPGTTVFVGNAAA